MERKKARKGTLKRLIGFVFKEHKVRLIIVVIAMVISTFANVLAMSIIQNIVSVASDIVKSGSTDLTMVVFELLKMSGFYLISIIFAYIYLRIMIHVGQYSLMKMREEVFMHMVNLPIKFFDENQHGDLMSVFTNDINATRQLISESMPQLILAFLQIGFYMVFMIITSPILSIFSITLGIVIFLTSKTVTGKSGHYFLMQQQSIGRLNGYIEEMIEGQKVVKIFNREEIATANFDVLNDAVKENVIEAEKRVRSLVPFTMSVGYFGYVVIAVVGGSLAVINYITIPALILFLVLVRSFIGPFNRLSNQFAFIGQATAGADRVFRVLEQTKEVDEGKYIIVDAVNEKGILKVATKKTNLKALYNPETNHIVEFHGDVRFNDVTFGYTEKAVLKDVSLFAKPGEKIAFVGSTGAGKTTVANLINRFYDIKEGLITFDGINVKDIKKDYLRNNIAVVLQDTSLFTTSVKENIRYGDLTKTDEEVIDAAKSANAHEFIMKLPQGYDTILTYNGGNLSQGQRQLLSIARAIVADRPVLILDEATSSVDTYTEKLIQDAMDVLMKGRTVFVIAHRLSTIEDSNAIIVLEAGKVIERGNHRHLIDSRGRYYEFYTGIVELE